MLRRIRNLHKLLSSLLARACMVRRLDRLLANRLKFNREPCKRNSASRILLKGSNPEAFAPPRGRNQFVSRDLAIRGLAMLLLPVRVVRSMCPARRWCRLVPCSRKGFR